MDAVLRWAGPAAVLPMMAVTRAVESIAVNYVCIMRGLIRAIQGCVLLLGRLHKDRLQAWFMGIYWLGMCVGS